MGRIVKGFGAGVVATLLLSGIMLAKAYLGVLPEFNAIKLIAAVIDRPAPIAWSVHFAIGVLLWGGLFGLAYHRLPRIGGLGRGLAFGVLAWLMMMVVFMPAAGAGFFAVALGTPVLIAALVLHLIYRAALGAAYSAA